eukprot:5226818-Lingulodinium_polyedra.AAC.1
MSPPLRGDGGGDMEQEWDAPPGTPARGCRRHGWGGAIQLTPAPPLPWLQDPAGGTNKSDAARGA